LTVSIYSGVRHLDNHLQELLGLGMVVRLAILLYMTFVFMGGLKHV
jgi:hypothetical protein